LETRPKEKISLALGDPTAFKDFKTNPDVINLCEKAVGKVSSLNIL
jgi:hypothetical protein